MIEKTTKRLWVKAIVAVCSLITACAAWGDTLTWSGSNAGSFTTPSNWTSADEGGTSTYGPRPGDTVKFTKAVDLEEETFDIGSAGLTIENSATLNNYVKFAGSGKIVKRGTGDMNLRTVSTHTGGTRLELGRIVMIISGVKTFGTGPVEVVYNGTSSGYSSRPQIHFAAWGSGLTNEVRVVDTHDDYAPLYCSNAATVSGPVYADGDFTIYNGYGSFTFTAPIHAHGHTVTAYCVDGRAGTYLNIKSSIDASLVKAGAKPMHISGVSDQIDASLTVNDGGLTINTTGVWGGTNVVVNGATNMLTLTALSNFSTPPVVRLLNGGTLSMPSVIVHVAELWVDGTRQSDGLYTAANMPAGVHAPGGVLIVGADYPCKVWTGGKSGLFSSGSNWSDGQPPATGDLLVFNKTVNLEAESTDIGADGMSLYVAQSCILTNNNAFTGSGLLTKLGKGRLRERAELESTGGFKMTDGIVELCVQDKALFKNATGTVELDYTGGTTPKLVGAPWNAIVKNHVKVTGNPPSNYNVVEQSNQMQLTGGIESGSDFTVCGYYGPLYVSGGISAPGKTMKFIVNGRHASSKTSRLAGTVDCSLVVSNYYNATVAIMEMTGNSPNPANSFTMLGCTNRLTAAAYWGGTNIVVRRAEAIIPAHLILNGENNLNPEATLTLADGGTVEVASGKKVCVAHLVTDGESRRNGVYTSANLPGYILGSGRIQVGVAGLTILFR